MSEKMCVCVCVSVCSDDKNNIFLTSSGVRKGPSPIVGRAHLVRVVAARLPDALEQGQQDLPEVLVPNLGLVLPRQLDHLLHASVLILRRRVHVEHREDGRSVPHPVPSQLLLAERRSDHVLDHGVGGSGGGRHGLVGCGRRSFQ